MMEGKLPSLAPLARKKTSSIHKPRPKKPIRRVLIPADTVRGPPQLPPALLCRRALASMIQVAMEDTIISALEVLRRRQVAPFALGRMGSLQIIRAPET